MRSAKEKSSLIGKALVGIIPVIPNTQIHHPRENDSSSCNSSFIRPDEQFEDTNIPVPNESVDHNTPKVKITLVYNKQKVNKICYVFI